jgi:hypothetical protein
VFQASTKSPQHYCSRAKFDGAVSSEGEQSGTMRSPSREKR